MSKLYICSQCGQEMIGYRDQCPHCRVSGDNLVEKTFSINEDYIGIEDEFSQYQDLED